MAIKTYTEQLESVQAAIAAIETGAQWVEVAGRKYVKGDIAALYAREERLYPLAKREAAGGTGGIRVRGITPVDV